MFRIGPLITLMLFIAIFTGQQGGLYIMKNRLQELGILCSILMFVLGAWFSLFELDHKVWKRWVIRPLLLVFFIMVTWSVVFWLNFGGNPLFSFFASREFFFILLCPAIYLMWQNGYDIILLRRLIWFVLVALMANYLLFYSTMDLEAAFFSTDPNINSLVTMDDWRGYRLKPPLYGIMLALLMSLMLLYQRISFLYFIGALLTFAVGAYIWNIVQYRSTLASMVLAIILYPVFLQKPNRIPLVLCASFAGLVVLPAAINWALDAFSSTGDSATVRLQSYEIAWQYILKQPFWGAGQASGYSLSYQDLFGPKFFPSDLGIVGVTFKFGVIGIALYLFCHFAILYTLWKTNWMYNGIVGKHEPLLWALFIWMVAQTINLPLNPALAYSRGITTAAMALALCGIYQAMLLSGELLRRKQTLQRF